MIGATIEIVTTVLLTAPVKNSTMIMVTAINSGIVKTTIKNNKSATYGFLFVTVEMADLADPLVVRIILRLAVCANPRDPARYLHQKALQFL